MIKLNVTDEMITEIRDLETGTRDQVARAVLDIVERDLNEALTKAQDYSAGDVVRSGCVEIEVAR